MTTEDVEPDDEILTIDEAMLHHERVDLEAGMTAAPRATIVLILVCAAVFAAQVAVGGLDSTARIVETGALQRDEVLNGQWWRLVSGAFMHASAEHLFGNMVMLYILGMACEHAFGLGRFLFLYTAAGIAGNALAMTAGDVPTVGASGAIFGLVGATIAMAFVHRRELETRDAKVGVVMAGWSAFMLVVGMFSPFVSNEAHFGGLVAGLALGATLRPVILDPGRVSARPGVGRFLLALSLAALVASFAEFLPRLQ